MLLMLQKRLHSLLKTLLLLLKMPLMLLVLV
jgi:hypothetical protein